MHSTVARNRWALAYTLINNPSLIVHRRTTTCNTDPLQLTNSRLKSSRLMRALIACQDNGDGKPTMTSLNDTPRPLHHAEDSTVHIASHTDEATPITHDDAKDSTA